MRCLYPNSDNQIALNSPYSLHLHSNLASEEEGKCSASTSAFVTPLSTRSQSPLHPPANADPSHHHATKEFAESLTNSLQKVEADRTDAADAQAKAEAVEADTSNDVGKPVTGPTDEDKAGSSKSSKKKNRKKRPNGLQPLPALRGLELDIPITYFSESQYSLPDSEDAEFVSPKTRRRKKNPGACESANSGLGDLGANVSSSGKPKKNLKVSQAPPPPPASQKRNKKKKKKSTSLESSSVSSASPTSSICSHSPETLSPSPTSSFSSQLPATTETPSSASPSLQSAATQSISSTNTQTTSEEPKDEWPDLEELASASAPAPPPRPLPEPVRVHTHLEVEAKVLEEASLADLVPEHQEEVKEEVAGEVNSRGATVEISGKEGATGGMALLPDPPMIIPTTASTTSVSYSPIVMSSGVQCFAPNVLGTVYGDPLSQGGGDMPPDQYLWMQHQQLKAFIQKHQEQHENQTDNQIFFPVEPLPETTPCALPLPETPPLHPMVQVPLLSPLLPTPPHPLGPSRPLFFPPRSPHSPQGVLGQPSSGLPLPPPPPPLPVHPYQTAPPLSSNAGESRMININFRDI